MCSMAVGPGDVFSTIRLKLEFEAIVASGGAMLPRFDRESRLRGGVGRGERSESILRAIQARSLSEKRRCSTSRRSGRNCR